MAQAEPNIQQAQNKAGKNGPSKQTSNRAASLKIRGRFYHTELARDENEEDKSHKRSDRGAKGQFED